jgi:gliding motility-associated-like protein
LETSNSCGKRVDTIKIKQGAVVVMPPKLQDTGICIGETIIQNITARPFHQYLWSDGDTNATKGFKTFGKYVLYVSTACQTKQDSFNIVLRRKPIKAPVKDTVFCASPILYSVNAFQPNCNYTWSDGTSNPSLTVNRSGKWWLITENRCGNRIDSFKVDKDTIPVKVLNNDEFFCQGQPLKIKAYQPNTGKYTYLWSTGDKGPEVSIPYSTTISLVTSNTCGTRTDFVKVNSYRCDCSMLVPNAFSPRNSDNLNDGWAPYFECQVRSGYYSIYNRWGECIVFQKSVLEPWDGKFANGEYVPEGVYAYIVHGLYSESVTGTRTFDQFGDLTIINGKK